MSRVTDSGHHISGAATPDLAYVAERAVAARDRGVEALRRLVAGAREIEGTVGPDSPAVRVAWHAVVAQARHAVALHLVAESRRVQAGLDEPLDQASLAAVRTIEERRFTVGDHATGLPGLAAATLLGILVDEPYAATLIGAYLALVDAPPATAYIIVTDEGPLLSAVPPAAGEVYYRVRRTR